MRAGKASLLFATIMSAAQANPAGNADTTDSIPLFNGKDLCGWVVKCHPDDREKTFWTVENEAIVADSIGRKDHDYVWLLTESEYGDFELTFRFRAFRESPGNSGIQLRSRYDDDASWLDGPQIDINPPGPWRTGMIWDETRGNKRWLWPEVPVGKWVYPEMARPGLIWKYSDEADGWNRMLITARGTRLKATLNGNLLLDWDGSGVLDDELHGDRRVGMKGHIALQIHRGDELKIAFRDIQIRELE